MATLANFPMKNQRTSPLADGSRDPNDDFDCVPESIAAGLQYLTGLYFEGGILKEIAYGAAYQGGTDAAYFVQICAQHGVQLYPVSGTLPELTDRIHTEIKAGHPCLVTEIDPYVDTSLPQWAGATHVLIMYGEGPNYLMAMDPFIATSLSKSDQTWQGVMAVGQIWIMQNIGVKQVAIALSTPGVRTYYTEGSNTGAWKCIEKNHQYEVHGAILTFYRMLGNAGLCGLTHLGLPLGNEYNMNIKGHPEVTQQDFERGKLRYDPQHVTDSPPGAGAVYLAHDEGVNAAQLSQAEQKATQAEAQITTLQIKINNATEALR